jgi:hypothetical protein
MLKSFCTIMVERKAVSSMFCTRASSSASVAIVSSVESPTMKAKSMSSCGYVSCVSRSKYAAMYLEASRRGVRISTRSLLRTASVVESTSLRLTCCITEPFTSMGVWWLKSTGVSMCACQSSASLAVMRIGGFAGPKQ